MAGFGASVAVGKGEIVRGTAGRRNVLTGGGGAGRGACLPAGTRWRMGRGGCAGRGATRRSGTSSAMPSRSMGPGSRSAHRNTATEPFTCFSCRRESGYRRPGSIPQTRQRTNRFGHALALKGGVLLIGSPGQDSLRGAVCESPRRRRDGQPLRWWAAGPIEGGRFGTAWLRRRATGRGRAGRPHRPRERRGSAERPWCTAPPGRNGWRKSRSNRWVTA